MTEPTSQPERSPYRFPAIAPEIAMFHLRLPPFSGAPQGFTGSLDGLLDQLREGSIDLRALPLAPLIEQYLSFLQLLPHEAADTKSGFLPLAAALIQLKSQLLAPALPSSVPDAAVHEEVLRRIAQQERHRREEATLPSLLTGTDGADEPKRLNLLDLMVLLQGVQAQPRQTLVLIPAELTIEEAIRWLQTTLPFQVATTASQYWEQQPTRQAQLAVFLAVLELVRTRSLVCRQTEAFGPLWIWREESGAFPGPSV